MLLPSSAVRWLASFNDGGIANQFFMALMVTIPVLNFGMLLGWLSPMTPILQSPDGPAPEPISDEVLSWMAALTFLPPIFCGFHMGGLIDKWGRKVFTILTSLFLAIASDKVRGALGSLFILAQNMGYLLIYIAGDLLPFAAVMWMCAAVPVLHILAFLLMPETPVFLIKQNKIKEAREALAWLRNTTVDDKNLEEAIKELEREEEYTKSMKQANFMSLDMWLPCGADVRWVHLRTCIGLHQPEAEPQQTDHSGWDIAVCGVNRGQLYCREDGSEVAAGEHVAGDGRVDADAGRVVPGDVIGRVAAGLAAGAGHVHVHIRGRGRLPTSAYRGVATSLIISATALSDFIQTKAYDPLLKLLGIHWVFIIFSIICFMGTFYTIIWVPETKGRTVEEIYAILEGKKETKDVETSRQGKEISRL
ncbi:unnamed protein product [Diatraea saccharalis]|uniref:Uncharacterized protein n=1 Tax=Diatraea saccharalis TaxID=40085 RepID=A0A9N9RA64_9NEOP|nr:unnamed protein product [Diatraea saccharalis]